ncbi:MAG: hypothetical protein AAB692_01430 [Patescibacteria group bacterium]
MKKFFKKAIIFVATAVLGLASAAPVLAQGMMGWRYGGNETIAPDVRQTAQDEAAGKEVWSKLKAGTLACGDLKEDDFDVLGDYFMLLMVGDTDSHAAMNRAMSWRLGDVGEKQMHVAMGKRLSGCDETASFSALGNGFYPMMSGLTGGGMMWGWGTDWSAAGESGIRTGLLSWWGVSMFATMLLAWAVLVLAIIALLKWISRQKR